MATDQPASDRGAADEEAPTNPEAHAWWVCYRQATADLDKERRENSYLRRLAMDTGNQLAAAQQRERIASQSELKLAELTARAGALETAAQNVRADICERLCRTAGPEPGLAHTGLCAELGMVHRAMSAALRAAAAPSEGEPEP